MVENPYFSDFWGEDDQFSINEKVAGSPLYCEKVQAKEYLAMWGWAHLPDKLFATRILVEGKCFSSNLMSSVPNKAKRSVDKEGGIASLSKSYYLLKRSKLESGRWKGMSHFFLNLEPDPCIQGTKTSSMCIPRAAKSRHQQASAENSSPLDGHPKI